MTRSVHQLLPTFTPGDAIGGAVFRTQAMLRRAGFTSEIFADYIDGSLASSAHLARDLAAWTGPGDALIYHLAIGAPVARLFERSRAAARILVYHNITPPRYFRDAGPDVCYWLERGRQELYRLAPKADLGIGDSSFNVEELADAGCRTCVVVPPPVDFERLEPRPARPANPPLILFVGRLAPNKCQEDLIRALAALRGTTRTEARLVLAGISTGTEAYMHTLLKLAERLRVRDRVEIPGARLSDHDLARHYSRASVLACASDHEGFCVPLLEAMAFSVPIVAFAAGAVPETLGDAGILVDRKDPLVWAGILERLITDQELRQALIARGLRRLDAFREPAVSRRLLDALAMVGVVAPQDGRAAPVGELAGSVLHH